MGGPLAIPMTEILAYLQLVGIASVEQRLKYLGLIQDLDEVWLDYQAEQAPKQ